ncbi:RagB/SusD family nutrient uptake outer membrane protein [Inquilinus sp. KBS0705]|nr:RagB/SusD family nutrient uptake outer membrane protein [Inquilinus sp. KBS0705]
MKNILKLLIATVLITSCKKGLELIPKDTISDATFYKTAADFKLGANNLYNSLPGFDFNDTQSDLAFNTVNDVSDGNYLPTADNPDWTSAYVYIRAANNLIAKGKSSTDAGINNYIAEAKFFRAFNYWQLFKLYGGVPLIDQSLDVSDEKLYTPRSSRQETADFIIKDLTEAAANLPLKSALGGADAGRIAKGTADALRARVALFEGTWEKYHNLPDMSKYLNIAIEAANSVINSNEYELYKGKGADSYRYLFIEAGDDSKESILDRRYEINVAGQSYPYLIDRICYLPTKKLADMYLCKDGLPINNSPLFQGYNTIKSEFENRDPRMTMTMIVPGTATLRPFHPTVPVVNYPTNPQRNGNTGYITYKYLSEDSYGNNVGETNNSHGFDDHLIRYAEVLLIKAEALFEKNNAISDGDLNTTINVIRNRVGMPPISNAFVSGNSLDMRSEIRRERSIELALEGFRYDDLRRWKTAETELPKEIKGIKIKGSEWQSIAPYNGADYQSRTDANGFLIAQPAADRTFDPNKHYLQPLPTREIALYNGQLQQNPGW